MIADRRGEVGFLEAIISAMAVCLVLTAFIGFLAAEILEDATDPAGIDRSIVNNVIISNGRYVDEGLDVKLSDLAERNGYSVAMITCHAEGVDDIENGHWGREPAYDPGIVSDRFMRCVHSDDDRIVPTVFAVFVCS